MFKITALMFALSLTSVFASDVVKTKIAQIELKENAKCELIDVSNSLCLGHLCFYSQLYQCISNNSDFKVKLKLKTASIPGQNLYTKIRRVKILD